MKKLMMIFLIVAQMLTLTSCMSNTREIQKIYLVVAMGIDLTDEKKYEVTMQVLNPSATATQTGGSNISSSGGETLVYSGIGEDLYDAVFNASKVMGRVQHFGHLKYIVMGEDLVSERNEIIKDTLFRLEEIRLNTPVLVTKGKASEIVSAKTNEGIIPANVVENLLERQDIVGYRPYTYLLDILDALGSENTYPVTGVINLVKPQDRLGSETFKLSGCAVFKGGILVGYLNDKETRGLNWIKGGIENGNISVNCPNLGRISLEILKTSSKIKTVLKDNSIDIQVKIKATSSIRGTSYLPDPIKDNGIIDEIEAAQNQAIKQEVELALLAAKNKFKADIFGFGERIHALHPKEWNAMKENWDSMFSNINVDIIIDSKIRGTGSILKSLKIK